MWGSFFLKETNHWCCLTFPNYTAGSTGAMWVKFLLKETTTTNSIIWESNLDPLNHKADPKPLHVAAPQVKNPQNLYAVSLRKYDTTVGHVLCVISCICTLFFNNAWWCVIDPLWLAHPSPPATVPIPKICHREV